MGALGALGRRFESCRPDLNLSEYQKQLRRSCAEFLCLASPGQMHSPQRGWHGLGAAVGSDQVEP